MRKIRLRTKFLLSLLVISAGLTSATLLIVRYTVQQRVKESIEEELRNSVNTYQTFDRQREATQTRAAELLANLPDVRALMHTEDAATIQDEASDIWSLSGNDLLLLADPTGEVVSLRTSTAGMTSDIAEGLLRSSLGKEDSRDWWFGGDQLYEVWIQPIYSGPASENTILGFLAVGHEIDQRAANELSNIAASEVAFQSGGTLVASTLAPAQQAALIQQLGTLSKNPSQTPQEIELGNEKYLTTTVSLSPDNVPPVTLSVLKSFDKATAFLAELNHVLLGLGLLTVLAGSVLVFMISDTFTRPLANLVAGVRALEKGDFGYPLESTGGDEVAEVTGAFDRMRGNLQKTQREQRLLEERLRQAHKMEAVGRLAGGVAHDFNNLLTIIRGHGDLLHDREGADDFQRRSVEQIQKAADRAVAMTRQLLAFSRMQVLQPSVLDLNAIITDMGKMLPRLIGEHIEYAFLPGPELSAVKADPGQIEQVIMNLAVNARDAMPHGGKLAVQTLNVVIDEAEAVKRSPMPPGRYVMLVVSDTGHGMDKATKAHIFEPFFTTKEVGKGTGLGLATVYGVVKQSGGFIWVESNPGQGASFEIYLPQALEFAAKAESKAKPSAIPRGSETILVVEDEAGVRELACQFLKGNGYSVLEARDGIEALEIAGKHEGRIHMVLSDIIMPKMGGVMLVQRLRASRKDIKVMLMSGYSEYAIQLPSEDSPRDLILQKPFSQRSLVGKVREVLTGRSAEQENDANGQETPGPNAVLERRS